MSIAQTFVISEPATGVEAVFLTKLDLFFSGKSSTLGVEVQIRETDNGAPTKKVVPYGSKVLESTDVAISSDSSTATTFEFTTPVMLRTNEQYAIVVVPVGGNADYILWTGVFDQSDQINTNLKIPNNMTGNLFKTTNDLVYTQIVNESLKYKAYVANFTSTSATAVFRNGLTDHFRVNNKIGDFIPQEKLVVSNNYLRIAALTISGANTYTVGERVFQPGGSVPANVNIATAVGTVYFSNTTTVLMSNVSGAFTTANTIRGATSNNVSAAPSFANQSIVTTSACNVITVPNANTSLTTDFVVGNFIYVGKNTGANIQILQVTGVDTSARTLTLDATIKFSDTDAIIGRVKDDANLTANFCSITGGDNMFLSVTSASVNATSNFAASKGALLMARTSGASVVIDGIEDLMYEGITTTIPDIKPIFTKTFWSFSGTGNNAGKTTDSTFTNIDNEIPYDFIDKTRIVMSRSNEFANPPSSGVGQSSLTVNALLQTSNTKITPYIDTIRNSVTTIHNLVYPESSTSGYIVSYSNSAGTFNEGDVVQQANSTVTSNGVVFFSNSTFLYITNVVSSNASSIATFNIANTQIYNATQAITANISAINVFNETGNNTSSSAKYISKNVVLAEQQDGEDLVCYVTAYRPPGSNFKVYGKFLAGADSDLFQDKDWSALVETTSSALVSSLVNRDDYVELVYELPSSLQVVSNGASGNTTSAILTIPSIPSTSSFTAGDFIYINDNTNNQFNVRQINQITGTTSMVLSSNLSFISSNCAVGLIPGMESRAGAFKYTTEDGVVRYVTSADGVLETFKTFAMKIVLVSNSYHVIPKMSDMRCLALQV
jgi:hypothetical protein